MELSARNSSNKVIATAFIILFVLLVMALSGTIILAWQNHWLSTHQKAVVTPMGFNAPFSVSEAQASPAFLQMMALAFLALRLNVSPETVDSQQQFLLSYVKPGALPDFKVVLNEEGRRIKQNDVNSSFYATQINVLPASNSVDIRGLLKTTIGNGKPKPELKHYFLSLDYDAGVTSLLKFVEVDDAKN